MWLYKIIKKVLYTVGTNESNENRYLKLEIDVQFWKMTLRLSHSVKNFCTQAECKNYLHVKAQEYKPRALRCSVSSQTSNHAFLTKFWDTYFGMFMDNSPTFTAKEYKMKILKFDVLTSNTVDIKAVGTLVLEVRI